VRKGEQTRREIIRKAAPIFNQKGYSGTALSDLMRAMGLENTQRSPHRDRGDLPEAG
jgi:TetR/AcrR family transcriptional repressor of nem operon